MVLTLRPVIKARLTPRQSADSADDNAREPWVQAATAR